MPVYVDPVLNYGWKLGPSCHMFADTVKELKIFAIGIGLKLDWFQLGKRGTFPHFDLTVGKRRLAVARGAIELDREATVAKWVELGYYPKRVIHAEDSSPDLQGDDSTVHGSGPVQQVESPKGRQQAPESGDS